MRIKTVVLKRTAASVGLMTLLWLLSTLILLSSSQAAIFFDSDFELEDSNDWAANGWTNPNSSLMTMSTEQAFTGSRSLRLTYDNIDGSSQRPSLYRSFPTSKHVFLRFAFRLEPAFQIGSNGGTKLMRLGATGGYPILWVMNKYGSYAFDMESQYNGSGLLFFCNRAPSRTSWDQVEVEYNLNDPGVSNGLLRMWVNGTLCIEQLNYQFIGPTPTSTSTSGRPTPSTSVLNQLQVYLQSGNGQMFYDRLAMGNTRIGLAGTSTGTDTAAPTIPTGVQMQ